MMRLDYPSIVVAIFAPKIWYYCMEGGKIFLTNFVVREDLEFDPDLNFRPEVAYLEEI